MTSPTPTPCEACNPVPARKRAAELLADSPWLDPLEVLVDGAEK